MGVHFYYQTITWLFTFFDIKTFAINVKNKKKGGVDFTVTRLGRRRKDKDRFVSELTRQ